MKREDNEGNGMRVSRRTSKIFGKEAVTLPVLSHERTHWPDEATCPICGKAFEGSFAVLDACALSMDRERETGAPSPDNDLYLSLLWHGAHREGAGCVQAKVDIMRSVQGGQGEISFCSTTCLQMFLNRSVHELGKKVRARAALLERLDSQEQVRALAWTRDELYDRHNAEPVPDGEREVTLFGLSADALDGNPDNGRRGIWRVDGVRHSCLVLNCCSARDARDKALSAEAVHEWELLQISFWAEELPEVFRV